MVTKRIRPSLTTSRLYNNGRQSSMKQVYRESVKHEETEQSPKIEENNQEKDIVTMDTKQKVELANAVLAEKGAVKAKKIKKDKGLIERKENTIILTEDNRELLND